MNWPMSVFILFWRWRQRLELNWSVRFFNTLLLLLWLNCGPPDHPSILSPVIVHHGPTSCDTPLKTFWVSNSLPSDVFFSFGEQLPQKDKKAKQWIDQRNKYRLIDLISLSVNKTYQWALGDIFFQYNKDELCSFILSRPRSTPSCCWKYWLHHHTSHWIPSPTD